MADDCSPEPAIRSFVEELHAAGTLRRRVVYMRQEENVGFVRNANAAFDALAPADVVLVNSDCEVPPGWLEGLRRAAESDSRVATVTPLTNNGTIVTVPERNHPMPTLPQDWTLERAARAVAEGSLRLYPQLPTAIGHCLYIRRAALDLTGGFDEAFSPGYGEEVDFSQRLIQHGMSHLLADDVLVAHYGSGSFLEQTEAIAEAHHEIIRSRYRYYDDWVDVVAYDEVGPLPRALAPARRALRGMSVTIDGRSLTQFITGTQVHTLEVIAALDALGWIPLRVVVPIDLGDYARELLGQMEHVYVMPAAEARPGVEKTEIVHRPYQVTSASDLELLQHLGRRIVVTQQDLISYLNPAYQRTFEEWEDYRSLTRAVLAAADHVVFFSRHAADEARAAGVIDESRADVVYLGTDHRLAGLEPDPEAPPGADAISASQLRAIGGVPETRSVGLACRGNGESFIVEFVARPVDGAIEAWYRAVVLP